MTPISAEDLLAGSQLKHKIEIPAEYLNGKGKGSKLHQIILRPLNVRDLQRIGQAAQDDEAVSAALMIQHSLVEPTLRLEQISLLPAGLARFLIEKINAISGVNTPRDELEELVQAPLAKACFILAREFSWTPEEVSGMTIGQILLYLEMAHGEPTIHE